jgi:demethoxyubiquinone hydroxylase (CLK1/Coq7/Cat5 family)
MYRGDLMNDQYLEYIVLLEKTLASFYGKIKNKESLGAIKTVLEFMESHSDGHALSIEESSSKVDCPALNPNDILNYQNSITSEASDFLEEEKDLLKILNKLSDTEEALGDFYKTIAGKMNELSAHYSKVSKIIDQLSEDEYNHRDILLRDKERLSNR